MPLDIRCIMLFFRLFCGCSLQRPRTALPLVHFRSVLSLLSEHRLSHLPTPPPLLSFPRLLVVPQGVSVSVSTFNLVAISLERYSAICNPLKSRVWQTKSHAAKVITATWVASFILMLPYPISSTLKPFTRRDNSTGHMCRLIWPNDVIQQSW